jgi:AAA+ ATPase superfamily predicted ATPase
LIGLNKKRELPFNFEKIGKWWYKDQEIDLIALNEITKQILFCEVKWSELKEGEAMDIINSLKEKSKSVKWFNRERKEYFGIIAKKIKNKEKFRKEGFFVYDIDNF